MAEAPETTDNLKPEQGPSEVSTASAVPPKRLSWPWTILLLLLLPAAGVGLWYGGTRHRVEDHPKKVKRTPRRLVPKQRVPVARPATPPATAPAMTPAMTAPTAPAMTAPAMTAPTAPAMTPAMTPPRGGMT